MKKVFLIAVKTAAVLVLCFTAVSAYASTTWYLAEGSTQGSFITYILIQNLDPVNTASVAFTFLKEDGTTVNYSANILAQARYTLLVNNVRELENCAFGTIVVSSTDISVERSMYWSTGGGTNSLGAASAETTWHFAEGCTLNSFDEWILILNPDNTNSAACRIKFMDNTGIILQDTFTVNPHSRRTLHVNNIYPEVLGKSISATVETTNGTGIVAERSMYWNGSATDSEGTADTRDWTDGHCSLGQCDVTATENYWQRSGTDLSPKTAGDNVFLDSGEMLIFSSLTNTASISGSAITSDYTLTLPPNAGSADQVLTTDGSGVLSWTTPAGGGVSSFNTRTGAVTPAPNDYTWAQINKTTSNIADITTKSHTSLTDIGTNTHAQIDTAITTSTTHIAATGTSVHGLGTISTQAANSVAITGGSITGITDLAVADGGTGTSTGSITGTGTLTFTAGGSNQDILLRPSGTGGIATGYGTSASGDYSTATGYTTTAQAYDSFVLGRYNVIGGTTGSWVSTDPLFVIGNGADVDNRSNAMTVLKNGNVGIGITNPGSKLEVVGDIVSKGTTWTARSAADDNYWYSVTYGNGLFVAVSADGAMRVMTSPDGITWTARSAASASSWYSVTYGNGLFVAVSTAGAVMTSSDGITWTSRSAAEANSWCSVTYGNGTFVAVSITGTNQVMTSPDGITWTARSATEASNWYSVTYGNDTFVAVSYNGAVMTSSNGITWTSRAPASLDSWYSVTYGNGTFVAVSITGTSRVMTSPDGVTWTSRTAAEDLAWVSVTYGDGIFVAVSQNGTNRVMTSPDGITWTARSVPETNTWLSVTYGNGVFVAISVDGTNQVMTSGKAEQNIIPTKNIYQGGMTINDGIRINEGTNATMGTAVLTAGTVTVNTTKVTANSRIFLTTQTSGGTPGSVYVSARTAGTSFTITSTSGTDTSTVAWLIIEPAS